MEEEVAERTKKLAKANKELKRQIAKRERMHNALARKTIALKEILERIEAEKRAITVGR